MSNGPGAWRNRLVGAFVRRWQHFATVTLLCAAMGLATVVCIVSPESIAARTTWQPWLAGLAILATGILLAVYLVTVAIHDLKTQRLCTELGEAYQRLELGVVEREQTKSTLEASELKFRTLYESSSDAIMMLTPEEGFFSGNAACVTMFGCKDENQFCTCTPADLSPERQPDGTLSSVKAQQMMAICMEKGSHFFDWTHQRIDGTAFPATVLLTRLELEGNLFLIATVRNATEQKRAEQALQESERRLASIIAFLPDATFAIDREGKVIAWNRAIEEMTGVPAERMLGRGAYAYAVPFYGHDRRLLADMVFEDDEKDKALYSSLAKQGDKLIAESFSPQLRGGEGAHLWIVAAPLCDSGGAVVGAIESVRDITELKQAQRRQARSLRWLEGVNRLQEDLFLPSSLDEKLKKITNAAQDLLDLDFSRIWIVAPGDLCERGCIHATASEECRKCLHREACLHLAASSGRYTHIDGDHRRVPIGAYKIGRIAAGIENKFLTNNVTTDPQIQDSDWACDLGLVSFAGYKLRDAAGAPVGVFAMFSKHVLSEEDDAFLSNMAEMTSRVILDHRTNEALRTSERSLRLFADNVSDVIWTTDVAGQFTYFSPSVEQLLGFRWGAGMQVTIADVMTADSLAKAQKTIGEIVAEAAAGQRPKTRSLELELLRKDGTIAWGEATAGPLYDESENLIGLVGVARNIADRKAAEEQALIFRRFAEASGQGLGMATLQGQVLYMNPALCSMLDEDHLEEAFQKTFPEYYPPEFRERLLNEVLPKVMSEGQWMGELRLVSTKGKLTPTIENFFLIRDEEGKPLRLADVVTNITEQKRMEDDLRKAKVAAEVANRAKSRFLATMSHEIRTPMSAILGYADLLMDPTIGPSTRNNYAATIRRSGEHLLTLINDILDLSKIEAGKVVLDIGRCNIVSLLADVASLVRPRAETHHVSFAIEYAGEMPETILTDGSRLRQAVVNLAGNAIKFTEKGGVRIVATFQPMGSCGQPAVKFDVIDTGIGIREEVLPQLFQPFSQGDLAISQRFGGTGLGLVISHHIAHLLGGDLTVSSVFGQGSAFTLTIPTGKLDDVRMLQRPAEVEHETAGHGWHSPTEDLTEVHVLLAEDGYDNRELIQTILQRVGAEVDTAENGRIAVNKAERGSYDVILMDMNMPEMDGYEATSLLRDRGYPGPILALTANAMAGDSERCLMAGCNEYLTKPINRTTLIQTIARHVGRTAPSEDQPVCDEEAIVSQFADDPDIAAIIEGFVDRLDGQIDKMREALASVRYDELRRLAHSLKGAGGSYGYPMLTEACKALEDAARGQNSDAADTALAEVAALVRAIHKGYALSASAGRTTS